MCAANDAVVKLTGAQLQNAAMKVKDMTDPRRNPAAFVLAISTSTRNVCGCSPPRTARRSEQRTASNSAKERTRRPWRTPRALTRLIQEGS